MLMKASLLETLTVQASDDELGKVKDVYFDSKQWAVRYFVIDSSKWLPGKKVLLSPSLIDRVDIFENTIVLKESKEQVKNGPTPDEHEPVSRKVEKELHHYYGWNPYWYGNGFIGGAKYHDEMTYADGELVPETNIQEEVLEDEEVHLRSMGELTGRMSGYTLLAKEREMGQVVDFMFDDASWTVQYFIIDTGDRLPEFKLFLSPPLIRKVDVLKRVILVDESSKELVRKSENIVNEVDLNNNTAEEKAKSRKVI